MNEPCEEECGRYLRERSLLLGMEVHATTVAPVVRFSRYNPIRLTCPHGVKWYMEETGESEMRAAQEGTL